MSIAERRVLLALETALDGGSVSIFDNREKLDWARGARTLSKSDDVLMLIEELLRRNQIPKTDIKFIVVSDGPGSLTGIRIGISIGKGLANSLAAELFQISILEAMTYQCESTGQVMAAIYTEKNGVFCREFIFTNGHVAEASDDTKNITLNDFVEKLSCEQSENISYVFTEQLALTLKSVEPKIRALASVKYCVVEGAFSDILGAAAAKSSHLINLSSI